MPAPVSESFSNLLLRHRGRARLTQRELAARSSVGLRSVQDWEAGSTYPSAERFQALIAALLEANGLTAGHETEEARVLWQAVLDGAPRLRTPFDEAWMRHLLAGRSPAGALAATDGVTAELQVRECRQDWGEAPEAADFVGRTEERAQLRRWVMDEHCRLIMLLGMGGIGKTSLAARLAQDVAPSFERVYWRSLRDAPPPGDWLSGAIGFLSDYEVVPPEAASQRLGVLLQLLRQRRCLVVLDNLETVFQPAHGEGHYREGLAEYGRVLQAAGETSHQSCVLVTSREAMPEVAALGGGAVRTFQLSGLAVDDVHALLAPKQLSGTPEQWTQLNARFGGNGLALKVVGETVRDLFLGEIGAFLEDMDATSLFGDIRRLLSEQIERSSAPEQYVLRLLAVEREPTRLPELLVAGARSVERGAMLEAVQALLRRSLVERVEAPGAAAFTLQSVVLEYVTDRLVEVVADEIQHGPTSVIVEQPLIKARAKDYVRQSQERLIGSRVLQELTAVAGAAGAERQLLDLLDDWRDRPHPRQGFGPGNVVDLLRLLRGNLRGVDLSHLFVCDAYLAEVEAQDATLAGAQLADTVLAEGFGFPASVAVNADGAVMAAGTSTGQVWLWRVADRTPLVAIEGHAGAIWGLALSADGQLLASGGMDGVVRLWDTATGRSLASLQRHNGLIRSVALSGDGRLVASGGTDGVVRLWDTTTGQPALTLQGHAGGVWRLAMSTDGQLLASAGTDGSLKLWETTGGNEAAILNGQTGAVRSVALSGDGELLASGDTDGVVRLWETATGQPVASLEGRTGEVWGVALSDDGQLLASGGTEGLVRLWQTSTADPVATLQGLAHGVWNLVLSGDGQLLVSGGTDGSVRLWETATGRPMATFQGHRGAIRGAALSASGHLLASVGTDALVRLWDTDTGLPVAIMQGHTGEVWSVALTTDGRLLASAGTDGSVRLWAADTGNPVATLRGHTGGVRSVALSADGHLLASGGTDGTVRLWNTSTGQARATLHGHTGEARGVALSADGQLLASGGADRTVRLWDTRTGQALHILQAHAAEVWGLALSADGQLLASGGADGTVLLWDTGTGRALATLPSNSGGVLGLALSGADRRLLAIGRTNGAVDLFDTPSAQLLLTLQGHAGGVPGVALGADGRVLATGSFDGTAKLWETTTGLCLKTLQPERRYERLDITNLTGASATQRLALLALGAIDRNAPMAGATARAV